MEIFPKKKRNLHQILKAELRCICMDILRNNSSRPSYSNTRFGHRAEEATTKQALSCMHPNLAASVKAEVDKLV